MKIPLLELGSLAEQMTGLKLSEGFTKERGRGVSRKSTPQLSRTPSPSTSPPRSRAASSQSMRSRSRSGSVTGSPTRTPTPSPERGQGHGKKRDIDMLDIGEPETTGHLTVKLSANKVSFQLFQCEAFSAFFNVQGATYGCDPLLAQSIDLELFRDSITIYHEKTPYQAKVGFFCFVFFLLVPVPQSTPCTCRPRKARSLSSRCSARLRLPASCIFLFMP